MPGHRQWRVTGSVGAAPAKRPTRPRQGQNAPRFNVHQCLLNMTGVDVTAIDGTDAYTGLKVISEIGLDMNRWPTVKHFASWLALCPGSKTSGGRCVRA